MRVRENFVGGRDFREEGGCGFDIAIVAVGVEFEGFAAIGFFYSRKEVLERVRRGKEREGEGKVLVFSCEALDAEDFVVASFYWLVVLPTRVAA